MSKPTPQDTTLAASKGEAPPARKTAAKKTAAKKTASAKASIAAANEAAIEPVAKKVTARKTAAKKTAAVKAPAPSSEAISEAPAKKVSVRKVASKKTAAVETTPELPFTAEAAPSRQARVPKAARATKVPKIPVGLKLASNAEPAGPKTIDEALGRYGRVPGGGPTAPRDSSASRYAAAAPVESTPFPQQAPPHQENLNPPRAEERREGGQQRNFQQNPNPHGRGQNQGQGQQGAGESRSKKRREKRKRRDNDRRQQGGPNPNQPPHRQQPPQSQGFQNEDRRPVLLDGPKIETNGMLELAPKGFGFLRVQHKNFEQVRDDVFVTPETIRKYNLRVGQWIHGTYQEGPRGPQLVEISQINDLTPEDAAKLPHFDELKAINPNKRISFETTPERYTTRVVDIMAPVGRGQRGLIVSPPRSGKTTLLLHMAEAIREKYDEAIHLIVVLVDERPEEVTEFRRALPGAEIYASSNDEQARNHTRIAELAIERAKRLVEAGRDVFLIMDSITRLARAYNGNMDNRGRGTGSGGLTIGSLEIPRRLFAAARNTRGGGSLTIMATALIQTNSRADEAIYMEFKGTGNMELVLDRKIAENYIYPAVDIFKSGTRREELLLADHMLYKIHLIRRGLSGHRPAEAMERLLFFLKKFPNNPQMLLEIKG